MSDDTISNVTQFPTRDRLIGVPRLVPINKVLDQVSICRTELYAIIRTGIFPAPIKIGRASRWLASDVDAFVLRTAKAGGLPIIRRLLHARCCVPSALHRGE